MLGHDESDHFTVSLNPHNTFQGHIAATIDECNLLPQANLNALIQDLPHRVEELIRLTFCPLISNQVQSRSGYSGFSQAEIVPDDAAGRWVFSGISHFLHPFIPVLFHTHLTSTSSALKTPICFLFGTTAESQMNATYSRPSTNKFTGSVFSSDFPSQSMEVMGSNQNMLQPKVAKDNQSVFASPQMTDRERMQGHHADRQREDARAPC
ncbi:hypothetical protein PR048_023592 [Dryococelus australis]|uniref:Uncharacterized protein n=1 Tax=Dryococelus australis TaxID=614101 RepID=A0ABQ9GUL6_9NEOP|nr:hypothetical protein PR048_023592 [Dryococelus australis]